MVTTGNLISAIWGTDVAEYARSEHDSVEDAQKRVKTLVDLFLREGWIEYNCDGGERVMRMFKKGEDVRYIGYYFAKQ